MNNIFWMLSNDCLFDCYDKSKFDAKIAMQHLTEFFELKMPFLIMRITGNNLSVKARH